MGLSRRIKYKFKFSRKYNTNVYNFFTKKKSTRKVFEEKYLLNFLQVERESLKTRFSILILKLWLAKHRQRKMFNKKKTFIKKNILNIKRKAKVLLYILFYVYKKNKKQQKLFILTKSFFYYGVNFSCFSKIFSTFLIFLSTVLLKKQSVIAIFKKFNKQTNLSFLKVLENKKKNVALKKKQYGSYNIISKANKAALKLIKYSRKKKRQISFFNKSKVLFYKLRNFLIFGYRHCKPLFIEKRVSVKKKHRSLFLGRFKKFSKNKKYIKNKYKNKHQDILPKVFSKSLLLSKNKANTNFLFFLNRKKNQNKKFVNFDLYKREGFEISWFFFDLLQNFYLYEKLQTKIYKEFKLLFVMALPFFSLKMRKFLLKTFFKQKSLAVFKYNQRAPRVFEFFFTKLQKKYGFRAMDVPFRLDVPLPRYKIKKQTEKLEMYKLLKITRRNYGHLSRKIFWKTRKKVYNKTKGYAFFNQLLFYESRLDIFLIRAQLCDSLQEARGFIFKGWICVNGKQIFNLHYVVTLMDIVSIFSEKMLVFKHFFLNKCLQLINEYSTTMGKIFPKYLESNFLNMAFCYVPKVFSVEKIPGQFNLNKVAVTNWGKFAY